MAIIVTLNNDGSFAGIDITDQEGKKIDHTNHGPGKGEGKPRPAGPVGYEIDYKYIRIVGDHCCWRLGNGELICWHC